MDGAIVTCLARQRKNKTSSILRTTMKPISGRLHIRQSPKPPHLPLGTSHATWTSPIPTEYILNLRLPCRFHVPERTRLITWRRQNGPEVNKITFHAERLQLVPNTCEQCHEQLPNRYRLDSHATRHKHKAYACLCGELFSRFDVLNRHIDKFNPAELHPCPYCTKTKPFSRVDHLTQHLRSFHNIEIPDRYDESYGVPVMRGGKKYLTCPHEDCMYHSQAVFNARREFTQHLRDAHDESPFPCDVQGCLKKGGKGFFRESDFNRHKKEHEQVALLALPSLSNFWRRMENDPGCWRLEALKFDMMAYAIFFCQNCCS